MLLIRWTKRLKTLHVNHTYTTEAFPNFQNNYWSLFYGTKISNYELVKSQVVLQVIHLYKEALETKHANTNNVCDVTEVSEKQSRTTIQELQKQCQRWEKTYIEMFNDFQKICFPTENFLSCNQTHRTWVCITFLTKICRTFPDNGVNRVILNFEIQTILNMSDISIKI